MLTVSEQTSFSSFPWGIHVHRDTEKQTTCIWPATISPLLPFFQTISSFLYGPQVSPSHLGWKVSFLPTSPAYKVFFFSFLFFFRTRRLCLPRSCGGSSLSFPSAGPAGKGWALLVTSDIAQPLPGDQMEEKCILRGLRVEEWWLTSLKVVWNLDNIETKGLNA